MEVRIMPALPIRQYGTAQTVQDIRVIYLFLQQTQPNNESKLKKDGTAKTFNQNKKKGKSHPRKSYTCQQTCSSISLHMSH